MELKARRHDSENIQYNCNITWKKKFATPVNSPPGVYHKKYPNPFTNFTTIEYDVPSEQNVVIRIFNIRGQTIRTLVNEDKNAGYYTVIWDGTNENGDEVSSGVYFCQMYTPKNPNGGQFVKAKKMVKIR